jgi:hypothetical protein
MAVSDLILAANSGVPANDLKPHNCHEAVLGWLLQAKYPRLRFASSLSHGVELAWLSLRSLSERQGSAFPKQLTGQWFGQHLYHIGYVPAQPPLSQASFLLGDVLFFGNRGAPHHSMVVVQKTGGQAFARGFNNAGLLGGPYMAWDATTYDVTDSNRWDSQNNFMGNNGPCELWTITYDRVAANIPDDLNF